MCSALLSFPLGFWVRRDGFPHGERVLSSETITSGTLDPKLVDGLDGVSGEAGWCVVLGPWGPYTPELRAHQSLGTLIWAVPPWVAAPLTLTSSEGCYCCKMSHVPDFLPGQETQPHCLLDQQIRKGRVPLCDDYFSFLSQS